MIGKWALGHQSKARDSVLRRSNTWGIAPMLETSAPDSGDVLVRTSQASRGEATTLVAGSHDHRREEGS